MQTHPRHSFVYVQDGQYLHLWRETGETVCYCSSHVSLFSFSLIHLLVLLKPQESYTITVSWFRT